MLLIILRVNNRGVLRSVVTIAIYREISRLCGLFCLNFSVFATTLILPSKNREKLSPKCELTPQKSCTFALQFTTH